MKYLVKISGPTKRQVEWAHVHGKHSREIKPTKAHIWVEEKNNTMCNMYSGMSKKKAFNWDEWVITSEEQPLVCRVCGKRYKNDEMGKVINNN